MPSFCQLYASIAISKLSKELFTTILVPQCNLNLELFSLALREMYSFSGIQRPWTYFCLENSEPNEHSRVITKVLPLGHCDLH